MIKHKIEIDLGRIGRTDSHDKWALIDNNDLNLWLKAEGILREATYLHDGVEARVNTDLSKITDWYKKHQSVNKMFQEALERGEKNLGKFLMPSIADEIVLSSEISLMGKNDISSYGWYPRFFVEKYIYDVFFIMNMSVPGSCEFLNLKIRDKDISTSERFYLSAYNFEEGYYNFLDKRKAAPIELPIETVACWYNELGIGVKQKADSNIEKAIFSLLHICKSDMDVTSIIWIFHALEAIYGTKVGESFTNLINRMSVLLELDKKNQKVVKKHLRELYDYRSSFVHGGYQVHHPMRQDVIDRRLDDDYSRIYGLGQIGFNLVVASIQRLIKNHWFGVEISEEIKGVTSANNRA